ncbi:MAG: hypothetical protein NC043_04755 [Muribaculaceae bacterium]|nr:hypothetical protein [Muribaculaceae bacterium]
MKKVFSILLTGLFLISATAFAANDNTTDKARAEHTKALRKELNEKASKDARKEAKRLQKENWKVAPGALSLEKQIDRAMLMDYELNDDGEKKFFIGSAMSIGKTFDAAKLQAMDLAKLDIAGQIESDVTALVESTVANEQLTSEEAESLVKTVSASKNLISQSIGRVTPIVEAYQEVGDGRNVMIRVAYSTANAKKVAKKVIKKQLEDKGDELHGKLDELLGW